MRPRYCFCVVCAVLATAAAALLLLAAPSAARAEDKPVSFINDIAPVFKENCFACHDSKKRSGKFDMTTFEKLMVGGANFEQIIPGKPDESELYLLITSTFERRMPPRGKGDLLSKNQTELVQRWIEQGAKLDGGINPEADLVAELRKRWQPPMPPAEYRFPTIVNALTFSPDGKQLVVGGHHELTVWDVEQAKLVQRIHTRAERAYAMVFTPDGTLVVAGGRPGQEGDVCVYDLNGPAAGQQGGAPLLDGVNDPKVKLAQLVQTDDSVLCLDLSDDGKKLAAGGCDRIVRVWNIADGVEKAKREAEIENHADWVLGVEFAGDGNTLFTCSRDKTAKVWDLKANESVLTFPQHQEPVFDVAVNPDGKIGFSVGADRQIRFWNTSDEGKQVRNSGGHGDEIYRLIRHPKEPWLITCSADKTVRVWDMNDGKNLKTLEGMTDYVYTAALSPDGEQVAAGAYDGSVKIWDLKEGKLVKEFNASPGFAAK